MTHADPRALAFLLAGFVWIIGFGVMDPSAVAFESWSIVPYAIAYIVLASLVIAYRYERLPATLILLWVIELVVMALLFASGPDGATIPIAIGFSLLYGSLAYIAWIATALVGLHILGKN